MNNQVLLISEKEIKAQSLIQYNVDSKIISRTILDTQNIYLRPILGNTLFTQVISEVYQAATTGSYVMDSGVKALLEEYIHPYLAHAVTSDVIINSTYRLTNKGMLKYNDSSASSLTDTEIEQAKNYHDNRTSSYKAVLIKYLQDNKLIQDECKPDNDIVSDSIGWFL